MSTSRRLTQGKSGLFRLLALGLTLALIPSCGEPSPSLAFPEGTPSDLQNLSQDVWEEFLAVFPNQSDCMGEVTLEGDWNLEGSRGFYLPEQTRVVLKIPATAGHLRHSLVHELAHHLEHACPDHAELRVAFLAAQNLAGDTPWFEGLSWEETPSEQYAETAVRLVLDRPVWNYRLPLTSEAVETVRDWGGGP